MNFKTDKVRKDWESGKVKQRLQIIVRYLDSLMMEKYNCVAVLTEVHRQGFKENDVHEFWRGIDVRVHNLLPGQAEEIEKHLNKIFVYDPARPSKPTCYLHGQGAHRHFHIQVWID